MESFYVTLPCKFNTHELGYYRTRLNDAINLIGTWVVDLKSISFPKTWFNIITEQYVNLIYFDPANIIGYTKNQAVIPPGNYTREGLLSKINYEITKHFDGIHLISDPRVKMNIKELPHVIFNKTDSEYKLINGKTIDHGIIFIDLSEELCDIMGFNVGDIRETAYKLFTKYIEFKSSNPRLICLKAMKIIF